MNYIEDMMLVLLFISTIKKDSIFEFTVFYQGIPQSADIPTAKCGRVYMVRKIKMEETG